MYEKTLSQKAKSFVIFALPCTIIFLAVVILPFLYGIYLTFTNWDGINPNMDLVGFFNYKQVFLDGEFWASLWLTVKYVFFSVININAVAFFLAYFLTGGITGQNVMRAGFFTPNLIGGVVLGFIWNFIFSRVLVSLGQSFNIGIFSQSWLSDPSKAFWAMVIVTTWQTSGYMMLIYVAGFMSIPKDLTEAASIDGCIGRQTMRHVILPLMVPSFVICLFLSLSRCFMVYDLNLAFTGGEPYGSTRMAAMYVYQKAFMSKQYGVGQAEAFILFIVVAAISAAQVYFGKKNEVES